MGEAMHVKGQELHGKSLSSSQLCCEPKTTAKILVSQKERKISKYFRRYILHLMTDKGLVSKIYKDFLQISKKKVNNLIGKNGQEPWTGISQMRKHKRPVHMRKDAQPAIRKIQITVIMKYHLPPTTLTKIKSVHTTLWRRFRTMELLIYRW